MKAPLASACITAVAAGWIAERWGLGPVDDAYISLRYAANLVAGRGLVYNVGEHVEGFSNPLLVLIEAVLLALGASEHAVLVAPGAVALTIVAALLTARIERALRGGRLLAVTLGSVIALDPSLLVWSRGGLEGCLLAALALTAVTASVAPPSRAKYVVVTSAAVLATLTRPEGILSIPFVVLVMASRPRERRAAFWVASSAGLVVMCLFAARFAYYGELLPNTYYAKLDGGGAALAARGFQYVTHGLSASPLLWGGAATALWWCLPPKRIDADSSARTAIARVTLLWLVLNLIVVVWQGGDHFAMYRFLAPLVPFGGLAAAPALVALWLRHPGRRARAGTLALVVAAGITTHTLSVHAVRPRVENEVQELQRHQLEVRFAQEWNAAGRGLDRILPPDASIATIAIGAIGYRTMRKIVDPLGLVDAHVAHLRVELGRGTVGHEKWDIEHFFASEPYAIVLPQNVTSVPLSQAEIAAAKLGRFQRSVAADPRLAQRWQLLHFRVDGGWLHLFVRRTGVPELRLDAARAAP